MQSDGRFMLVLRVLSLKAMIVLFVGGKKQKRSTEKLKQLRKQTPRNPQAGGWRRHHRVHVERTATIPVSTTVPVFSITVSQRAFVIGTVTLEWRMNSLLGDKRSINGWLSYYLVLKSQFLNGGKTNTIPYMFSVCSRIFWRCAYQLVWTIIL